jgi:pimeloyl-ACP methyl ester carboxylesterase
MIRLIRTLVALAVAAGGVALPRAAMAEPPSIGIVVMHGKGGSPTKFVSGLASSLADKGYLVANLEMPWSGRRDYDVSVSRAEAEVESALAALRSKGAQKVFVAGHSQGGAFAAYFAGKHDIDGVIAIAPGGDTGSPVAREKLGESVARARQAVAEGKGEEKLRLLDYEGSRGTYPIVAAAAVYLDWFDPEGAMNLAHTALALKPQTPILWLVAKNDYPGLRRANIPLYGRIPANPLNAYYEPNSSHLEAPSASLEEIVRWIREVANAPKR